MLIAVCRAVGSVAVYMLHVAAGVRRRCPRLEVETQATAAYHCLFTSSHGILCQLQLHNNNHPQAVSTLAWNVCKFR